MQTTVYCCILSRSSRDAPCTPDANRTCSSGRPIGRQTMKILALETSDRAGSVAAMLDANVLAELTLETTQRSAQSLAPPFSPC